jgi:threonine synthase
MQNKFNAYFRCISGCPDQHSLDEVIYRCPKCDNLLEVYHEIAPLKELSGEEWKKLFDSRSSSSPYPFGSGIWSKKEWILPNIKPENIVSTHEGYTTLLPVKYYGESLGLAHLYIKQCGNSHTGSFKDLGMTVLVSQVNEMIQKGKPIKAIAAASTGDTSAALSAYAALAGIPSIVLLPKNKVSLAQLIQPVSNGAIVLSLDTDFDGCMEMVKKITQDNSIYLANSMNSLRIEGQKSIAMEICQQLGWKIPDWLIIPGGNLGNVSALGKGFAMMLDLGLIDKKPRIVVSQAQNANPLYLAFQKGLKNFKRNSFAPMRAQSTLASAIQIGNPVSVEKAVNTLIEFDGLVDQASEQEIIDASARADKTGLFNCPHTAVALAVLQKLVGKGQIKKDELTVVISTAHGLKFSDQKVLYHSGKLPGVEEKFANPPLELPNDEGRVRDALAKRIPGFK